MEPRASLGEYEVAEDAEWAALASAEGAEDELDDSDCASAVAAVDAAALELGRVLSSRMLAAKAALAQKGQARQAQVQAAAAAEHARLEALIEAEMDARAAVEQKLDKSFVVQQRLATALAEARESGAQRLGALAVLSEWQRSKEALRREAHVERIAPRHAQRVLQRKVLCGWRSVSRALRHARIDAFWERSLVELRQALQAHYEPALADAQRRVEEAHEEAATAWQAKEELGKQLKAAFMRGVCALNLETASILGSEQPGAPRAC